jgi:hypothetical protein
MKLAAYTKQEARLLEDLYIKGYKKEGIWGKGRTPANETINRPDFATTPAGVARQKAAEQNKQKILFLVQNNCNNVAKICRHANLSETVVRRYLRALHAEGKILLEDTNKYGGTFWRPV